MFPVLAGNSRLGMLGRLWCHDFCRPLTGGRIESADSLLAHIINYNILVVSLRGFDYSRLSTFDLHISSLSAASKLLCMYSVAGCKPLHSGVLRVR